MNLHENLDLFIPLIMRVAECFDVGEAVVEKDYYVSRLLRMIVQIDPFVVFKGGTSLSKCYGFIHRFSEDIDISVENKEDPTKPPTIGQVKKVNKGILNCCLNSGFGTLRNPPPPEKKFLSGSRFRSFVLDYPSNFRTSHIDKNIRVEVNVFNPSYPNIQLAATSYITSYLEEQEENDFIVQYDLAPFEVRTQRLEKTFIDKVYAICDCLLTEQTRRNSRHIYDLYKIFPLFDKNKDFKALIDKSRFLRNQRNLNPESQYQSPCVKEGVKINDLLKRIIDEKTFKKDYLEQTDYLFLGGKKTSYDEAITVLSDIIDLNMF